MLLSPRRLTVHGKLSKYKHYLLPIVLLHLFGLFGVSVQHIVNNGQKNGAREPRLC
jgi:hypothetical protein